MIPANLARVRSLAWKDANRTRLLVVIQGTIAGLAGIAHGIFAILLGNRSTAGPVLDPATGAFTVLPTYLISGIATVIVGLALMGWTIGFIHQKNGPPVFLILCIVLFLAGGGIAQVGFFLLAWGVSTRINQPPNWWKSDVSGATRRRMAGLWPAFFTASYLFLFTGIAIWLIYTPPGTSYAEHRIEYWACWSTLITGLVLQIFTIVSSFAHDVERQVHK